MPCCSSPAASKRGLQPNVQAGPPREGETVTVVVGASIRGAKGAELMDDAERGYRVGPAVWAGPPVARRERDRLDQSSSECVRCRPILDPGDCEERQDLIAGYGCGMKPIADEEIRNVITSGTGDLAEREVLGGFLDRIRDLQRRVGVLESAKS